MKQGGNDWKSVARFKKAVLGVESMAESAARIAAVGKAQPAGHGLVMLAHNGPSGESPAQQNVPEFAHD